MHQLPIIFALLVPFCSALTASESTQQKSPNIILIVADDLGYADVGFNGSKDIPTPHIDSLANHGVRFTNGYVTHSSCSPSRAGLLTGRYQQRFGHEQNPLYLPNDTSVGLPLTQITLPHVLSQVGYVTSAIGKWHLGAAPCFHPNMRGFADFTGFMGGGHNYTPSSGGPAEYGIPLVHNNVPVEYGDYLTDFFSREAVRFIDQHAQSPFFLYLAYNAPHTPLRASKKYLERFSAIADKRRQTYAAMVSALDDGVGMVLDELRKKNLENNTQIWFLSDNGGPPNSHAPTVNTPLRGNKGMVYEGGIRVPFVVQWRGHTAEGKVIDEPISALDIFPSSLAVTGAPPPANVVLDGLDITSLLIGSATNIRREALHWRQGGKHGEWAIRAGDFKLLRQDHEKPAELYDLAHDIAESTNLAGSKPDIVARLQTLHDAWNAELIEPLWTDQTNEKKKRPR